MFRWYERRESHPDIPMTSSLCQRLSRSAPAIIQISLITITVVQLHHEQHRRQSWFLRSDSVDQCFIIIIIIIVVIITCVSQCLVPSATERRGGERRGEEGRGGVAPPHCCSAHLFLTAARDRRPTRAGRCKCRGAEINEESQGGSTEQSSFCPHIHSSSRSRDTGKSTAPTSLLKK